jgi:hypothetical protein
MVVSFSCLEAENWKLVTTHERFILLAKVEKLL